MLHPNYYAGTMIKYLARQSDCKQDGQSAPTDVKDMVGLMSDPEPYCLVLK
jgi:hypothetical protein